MGEVRSFLRSMLPAYIAVSCLIVVTIWQKPVFAATVVQTSVTDLAIEGRFIVSGTVVGETYVTHNALGLHWNVVKFRVSEVLKKPDGYNLTAGHEILISTLSGSNPSRDLGMMVPGAPKLPMGDNLVVVLEEPNQMPASNATLDVFNVVALSQGVFHMQTDAAGVVRLERQEGHTVQAPKVTDQSHNVYGSRFLGRGQTAATQEAAPAEKTGITFKEFKQLVRDVNQ